MTKQQIKDALEKCASTYSNCTECAYNEKDGCADLLLKDAAEAIEPDCAVFDKVEEYENCTVQVLINTKTGAVSIGWRENK